jgi:rubrerythrin
MLEIATATLFLTVAVVAIGKKNQQVAWSSTDVLSPSIDDELVADLPCPWCNAQTAEQDRSCPSCGQRFG